MVPPSRSGNGCLECLAPDGKIDELTNRIFIIDHQLEIANKISRIWNFISVVTPTVECDTNLTIVHIGDVINGTGFELACCLHD